MSEKKADIQNIVKKATGNSLSKEDREAIEKKLLKGIKKETDGTYLKRNDGGMAMKTRMF